MENKNPEFPLDWVEDNEKYISETPYGKAIITEVNDNVNSRYNFNAKRFILVIKYSNDTSVQVHQEFDSFESAAGWAYLAFQEFRSEQLESFELSSLISTLDACRHKLSDTVHQKNINRIEQIVKKHFDVL